MGYIGLFAAALIICLLAFTNFKSYFKTSESKIANQVAEVAPGQSIDTSSYQSTLGDIKAQLKISTQQEIDRASGLEEMK